MTYVVNLEGWETRHRLPDVYSEEFTINCDRAASQQCEPRKQDPFLLGYFIGNEPPWPGRESIIVEMILAGPATDARRELQGFLGRDNTSARHKSFVYQAYRRYVDVVAKAIRSHDPNHLILGPLWWSRP